MPARTSAVKALVFDVFGTVVDWRGSLIREGKLPWTKIDALHRMILDGMLVRFAIRGLSGDEIDQLNRAWHRLRPWPDVRTGLGRGSSASA